MARRTFTFNGITYSSAPAGWLKCAKDEWNDKLTRRGHKMRWRKSSRNAYTGVCRTCGGGVVCGSSWSTSHGYDIRNNGRCRPQGQSPLRLVGADPMAGDMYLIKVKEPGAWRWHFLTRKRYGYGLTRLRSRAEFTSRLVAGGMAREIARTWDQGTRAKVIRMRGR